MDHGTSSRRDIIVIGSSAGGVPVLLDLVAALPPRFPASILLVQHIGAQPSVLPELLNRRGRLPASFPSAGQLLEPGTVFVAPPDQHLLLVDGAVRLTRDAKENHARPAIDPLFRSAAIAQGSRVIGVILSGRLDDGTSGLQAIKACGGVAVVQDPDEAEEPSMPRSAIDNVGVDAVVPSANLAQTLQSLVGQPAGRPVSIPVDLLCEHQLSTGEAPDPMQNLDALGKPSKIVCPECSGVLWELSDTKPQRYRCHTGHAFTLNSLLQTQASRTDTALWSALRALQEREQLLRSAAQAHRRLQAEAEGARLEFEAEHIARHSQQLQRLITGEGELA